MNTAKASPDRVHALDNLRALMMWLGIVLHVSVNHLTGPLIVAVIHVFRMPMFLMLAGYFVALLVEKRGPLKCCGIGCDVWRCRS